MVELTQAQVLALADALVVATERLIALDELEVADPLVAQLELLGGIADPGDDLFVRSAGAL